jgi:uncharacterized oligopeptide transporter (OPT) family protein
VGLAIYLPSAVITPVVIGAMTGYLFDRAMERRLAAKRPSGLACW